jgi:predicted CXXCH cytochrome family protein
MLLALCCVAALALGAMVLRPAKRVRAQSLQPQRRLDDPDRACARCHQAIYASYEQTTMARDSGIATDGMITGNFAHADSGVDYRMFLRDGSAWMSYDRPATDQRGALHGERQSELYVGSGQHGRTYLYRESDRWYELPINYYTRQHTFGMAPAYDHVDRMPAPLPVDPNCLHCHATEVQPSLTKAVNAFRDLPFRQGGVGCSSCHGDATQHLATEGRAPVVNPTKLDPERRDSVCLQCHLEGDAVVYRPGRSLASFQPGERLSDTAIYFVRASQQGGGERATSQYEALLRSACKRASGDKLTCTTCHDPHSEPAPAQRVAWFRARCLSCHNTPAMATHHVEQPDCAACHMPKRNTSDISHEQVSDHDIERVPRHTQMPAGIRLQDEVELVPVGSPAITDRETGLAYAQLAQRGNRAAARIAYQLLSRAEPQYPRDLELHLQLGYLQQLRGERDGALRSYTIALEENPWERTALANLAVLDAAGGHLPETVHLLERLTTADPSQTAAGLNLLWIDCNLHRTDEALRLVQQLTAANPDDAALRQYEATGYFDGSTCKLASP